MKAEDPARVAEVREWLGKVATDFRAAKLELDASPPIIEDAVFHAQQAAEKSLKAFLAWHDLPFRKTHDIEELGLAAARIDAGLEPFVAAAVPLSDFAWAFRYPGSPEPPSLDEARVIVSHARELFDAIASRLPASVRQ